MLSNSSPGGQRGCFFLYRQTSSRLNYTGTVKALSSGAPNLLVDFVLENVQVVGGCHSYHVIFGVPGSVEDLLVEVQAVHADFILLPLAASGHFARFERSPGFAALPGRLQCDVPPGVAVKHSEEVVVGASHDGTDGERQ